MTYFEGENMEALYIGVASTSYRALAWPRERSQLMAREWCVSGGRRAPASAHQHALIYENLEGIEAWLYHHHRGSLRHKYNRVLIKKIACKQK